MQTLTADDSDLTGSVGVGGANRPVDVKMIQDLLNQVAPADGGPAVKLAVDGIAGTLTCNAIRQYQYRTLGWADGRVDPYGPTLASLQQADGPGGDFAAAGVAANAGAKKKKPPKPPTADDLAGIARVARAAGQADEIRIALHTVLLKLDFLITSLDFTIGGPSASLLAIVNKHFKTGTKPSAHLKSHLYFIQYIYSQMELWFQRRSIFNGQYRGQQIFDYNRSTNKSVVNAFAYTGLGEGRIPRNQTDRRYTVPVQGGTIYLCKTLDSESNDLLLYNTLHELAHFVGDYQEATGISDKAYRWDFGKYNHLGNRDRMHNADTYGIFAAELHFGTDRLAPIVSNNPDIIDFPRVENGGIVMQSKVIELD